MPPPKINSLTSLRAFAAFWVVLFHYKDWLYCIETLKFGTFDTPVGLGYLGVDIFFILSGFILCHVYQRPLSQWNTRQTLRFLAFRLARIYPAHLFILLLTLVYLLVHALLGIVPDNIDDYPWQHLIYNVLLIHTWGLTDKLTWNYPSWSISAEWFAYLAFPFLAGIFFRLRSAVAGLVANLALILILYASLYSFMRLSGTDGIGWTYDYALIRVMAEFSIGCGLYNIFGELSRTERLPRLWGDVVGGLALVGLSLAAFAGIRDILLLPGFAVLILSLALARGPLKTMMENRVCVSLGEISYSIYMVHAFVQLVSNALYRGSDWRFDPQTSLLLLLTHLILVVIAAYGIYHYVERPWRERVRHRILSWLNPSGSPSLQAGQAALPVSG